MESNLYVIPEITILVIMYVSKYLNNKTRTVKRTITATIFFKIILYIVHFHIDYVMAKSGMSCEFIWKALQTDSKYQKSKNYEKHTCWMCTQ